MNQNEAYYRKVISAIGFSMLIFLLLINLVSVGVVFLSVLLPQLSLSQVAQDVIYQILYAAGYLLSFMLPVAFLHLFLRGTGKGYRPMYSALRISPYLPLILFSSIALILSAAYVNASLVDVFGYSRFMEDLVSEDFGSMPPYLIVLQFIVMCVVPGFCEEFLFRGAILTNCLPFGRSNAILISSLLFALMHQNAAQIFYAFAAGILLGVLYERTGSIWNCTILHIANNLFSLSQSVLAGRAEGEWQATGYAALMEIGILVLGIVSMAILIVRFFSQGRDARDGIFEREIPAADEYATAPVAARRAWKLFATTPSMLIFLILCTMQIVMLLITAVLYGML